MLPADFRRSQGKLFRLLALLLLFIGVILLIRFVNIQDILKQLLAWVAEQGVWGVLAFVIIYVLACILFLPGSILTLGAGVLFGVWKGTVIVSVAATLGATAAFLVGRYLTRDWVAAQTAHNQKFQAINQAVAREGWKIVGLTRLSPIFPFNLLNYGFGLTKVSLKDYFLASWLGMMPGTVMYVYIGSLAGDLAQVGMEGHAKSTAEWILYVVGLVATVVVTVYITRLAKRALETKIDKEAV